MTFFPSIATAIPEKAAAKLFADDAWMAQEKKDGKRIMVHCDGSGWLYFFNKAGEPTMLPKGATMPSLPHDTVVDCEYLYADKMLCALDLLKWNGCDIRAMRADDRYIQLLRNYDNATTFLSMSIVPCAMTLEEKAVLLEKLRSARAEGMVLKRKDDAYTPGKISSGGPVVKVPWRKRMDVVLVKPTLAEKRHFEIWAYQDERPVRLGEIAAASWWDFLVPGGAGIFEIEYLYASKNGRLVQPQIVRPRTDKKAVDCLSSQAVVGGRHAS